MAREPGELGIGDHRDLPGQTPARGFVAHERCDQFHHIRRHLAHPAEQALFQEQELVLPAGAEDRRLLTAAVADRRQVRLGAGIAEHPRAIPAQTLDQIGAGEPEVGPRETAHRQQQQAGIGQEEVPRPLGRAEHAQDSDQILCKLTKDASRLVCSRSGHVDLLKILFCFPSEIFSTPFLQHRVNELLKVIQKATRKISTPYRSAQCLDTIPQWTLERVPHRALHPRARHEGKAGGALARDR